MDSNLQIGLFSFFSGAGFLDLGFERTDSFQVKFVNEVHKPFLQTYRSARERLGIEEPEFGFFDNDVTDFLSGEKKAELSSMVEKTKLTNDMIGFIGGPPCPDFSVAGKNQGANGENGKLSDVYTQLIVDESPDFFLFENVKGLYRTKKHRAFFESMKARLKKSGYCITEKVVNAIEYGVPQDRERIILIGFKDSCLRKFNSQPSGTKRLEAFEWDKFCSHSPTIVDSHSWPTKEQFSVGSKRKAPSNIDIELTVQHWFEKNDVENHPNSAHCFQPRAGLSKFQTIDEGDDLKKSYKRLHRWRYSPTAAYGNNEVHLHPYKARRISVAEALAIQSLPKDFIIPEEISLTNMFKTVGNGVPYLAAKGIASTIEWYASSIAHGAIANA